MFFRGLVLVLFQSCPKIENRKPKTLNDFLLSSAIEYVGRLDWLINNTFEEGV